MCVYAGPHIAVGCPCQSTDKNILRDRSVINSHVLVPIASTVLSDQLRICKNMFSSSISVRNMGMQYILICIQHKNIIISTRHKWRKKKKAEGSVGPCWEEKHAFERKLVHKWYGLSSMCVSPAALLTSAYLMENVPLYSLLSRWMGIAPPPAHPVDSWARHIRFPFSGKTVHSKHKVAFTFCPWPHSWVPLDSPVQSFANFYIN